MKASRAGAANPPAERGNDMTTEEAKALIAKDFIEGFTEWLKDEREMSEDEYGRKYGFGKGMHRHDDSYKSFTIFLDDIYCGRYIQGWNKVGYESRVIYALHKEGFLSYKLYTNWDARMRHREDFYYINRKTAKTIHNQYKAGKIR